MSKKRNVQGEGNYEASRIYDSAAKKFVQSGRVEEAARSAEPKSRAEADEQRRYLRRPSSGGRKGGADSALAMRVDYGSPGQGRPVRDVTSAGSRMHPCDFAADCVAAPPVAPQ